MRAPVKQANFWTISVVLVGKNWSPWPRNIFRIVVQSSQVTPIPVFPAWWCGGCLSWPLCHLLHWRTHPIKNACLYKTPPQSEAMDLACTMTEHLKNARSSNLKCHDVYLLERELWKLCGKNRTIVMLYLALGVSGESSSTGVGGLLPVSWSSNSQYPFLQSLRKARPVS